MEIHAGVHLVIDSDENEVLPPREISEHKKERRSESELHNRGKNVTDSETMMILTYQCQLLSL